MIASKSLRLFNLAEIRQRAYAVNHTVLSEKAAYFAGIVLKCEGNGMSDRTQTARQIVAQLRQARGMSQSALAAKADIAISTLSDFEAARSSSVRLDTLEAIATALDVDIFELISDPDTGETRGALRPNFAIIPDEPIGTEGVFYGVTAEIQRPSVKSILANRDTAQVFGIMAGDRIFIDTAKTPRDGDLIATALGENEAISIAAYATPYAMHPQKGGRLTPALPDSRDSQTLGVIVGVIRAYTPGI